MADRSGRDRGRDARQTRARGDARGRPRDPARTPDREKALTQYRHRAEVYDYELKLLEPLRRRAIERLGLRLGDVVIDAGCGTGLSFGALIAGVGAKGHVIGIEQSPEMIEKARARVQRHGWRNVTLVEAPVENARIERDADAALFHLTHDVLRRPSAVSNVVDHLKIGARVVASGLNWSHPLALPVNLAVLVAAWRSVTTYEGLARPWSHLEARVGPMHVEHMLFGAVYVASAVLTRQR